MASASTATSFPPLPPFGPWKTAARLALTVSSGAVESLTNCLTNLSELFHKPDEKFVQPMNGKVCIVTGCNAGIGLATAKQLARRGAHVILACRSVQKAQEAAMAISLDTLPLPGCSGPVIDVMELDLCRLQSVNGFCKAFHARKLPLHLLVCNAGIMSPVNRLETPDGMEMQFQVNFLSHWLLTNTLLGEQRRRRARGLKKHHSPSTTKAMKDHSDATRVVIVTSLTHSSGILQWNDMQSTERYSPFRSYALSKLANVIAAREFQRRIDRNAGGDDTAVSVHPGVVDTHLANNFFKTQGPALLAPLTNFLIDKVGPWFMKTTEQSGRVMMFAALAPARTVAGQYVADSKVQRPDESAEDPRLAQELWDVAQRLTGVVAHPTLA